MSRHTRVQEKTPPKGLYTIRYGSKFPPVLNLPLMPLHAFKEVRAGQVPTP
ncbi:hypothetical protein [Psychrobacter alimentarius]|uniref:hypothetical protein n=1 Tax=Psychrobacter alimentarius TaxID=261164 RepID=UPI003FD1DF3B